MSSNTLSAETELDPSIILEDYLLNSENLAPEIKHLFSEIRSLDGKTHDLRKAAANAQMSLYKTERLQPEKSAYFPSKDENNAVNKIRKMYQEAINLSFQKSDIAEQALHLLNIYIHKLDAEFLRLGLEIPEDPEVPEAESDQESEDQDESDVESQATHESVNNNIHRTPLVNLSALKSFTNDIPNSPIINSPSDLSSIYISGIRRPSNVSSLSPILHNSGSGARRRRRLDSSGSSGFKLDGFGSGNGDEEKVYCFCKQGSYGDMIGCDNPNCPIEWFHYECVGLNAPPKGEWFCPTCAPKMRCK